MTIEDFISNFDKDFFNNRIFVAFRNSVVEVGDIKVEEPIDDKRFKTSVSFYCTLGEKIDLRHALYMTFHLGDDVYICTFNSQTKIIYIKRDDAKKD